MHADRRVSWSNAAAHGMGRCAGDLDITGLSLFAIQFLWQMPHFFAIALDVH